MRYSHRACLFLFFCAITASWPVAALGNEPSQLLHECLAGLGQDDFAIRQEATQRLLLEPLDLEILRTLYATAQHAEQRHRLMKVARHHMLRLAREDRFKEMGPGAIGIQHDSFAASELSQLDQPGLLVAKTFPGFPGYVHLQPGDLIIGIDGEPFPANLSKDMAARRFIDEIQNRQAGGMVRLEVYRDGHKLSSVSIQLASLSALQAMYHNAGQLKSPFIDPWVAQKQRIIGQPQGHIPVSFERSVADAPDPAQPPDR